MPAAYVCAGHPSTRRLAGSGSVRCLLRCAAATRLAKPCTTGGSTARPFTTTVCFTISSAFTCDAAMLTRYSGTAYGSKRPRSAGTLAIAVAA
jgi:hypothetical protein